MEAAFTLYYSNKHETQGHQTFQAGWDNLIKKYASVLDKVYQKVIGDLRNSESKNEIHPEFVTHVEFLS